MFDKPVSTRNSTRKQTTVLLAICQLVVLSGLVSAAFLVPSLHRLLPSDLSRNGAILDALQSTAPDSIVAFGHSVCMSGFDAARYQQIDSLHLQSYNFCSSDQSISESLLFYKHLPNGVRRVIQFLRVEDLAKPIVKVKPSKLRNLKFYGYNFDNNLEEELEIDLGLSVIRDMSDLRLAYESRSLVVDYLNRSVRSWFRRDLDLDHIETNFKFPNVYKTAVRKSALSRLINRHNPNRLISDLEPDSRSIDVLQRVNNYVSNSGGELVVVFYPMNPLLSNFGPSFGRNIVDQLQARSVRVIDLTRGLGKNNFVDQWHLSKSGGKKMTDLLVERMQD